jgi:hypothetical protein
MRPGTPWPTSRAAHHRRSTPSEFRNISTRTLALLHEGPTCRCHGDISIQLRGTYHVTPGSCCERCVDRCGRDLRSILFSVVMGMVDANWAPADGWHLLFDPANIGGRHIQRVAARNQGRADRELRRTWTKAERLVAANPAPVDEHERVVILTAVLDAIESRPYLFSKGVAGVTERAAMRAVVGRGLRTRSTLVPLSTLELTVEIVCTAKTARAVFARLVKAGMFLEVFQPHTMTSSTVYRIKLPSRDKMTSLEVAAAAETGSREVVLSAAVSRLFGPDGLGRGVVETLAVLPLLEIPFGRGMLIAMRQGEGMPAIRESLARRRGERGLPRALRGPGLTAVEIADERVVHPRTARRHLVRLQQVGLVRRYDGLYYRVACSIDRVCEDLAVPATEELKAAQAHRQRQCWRSHLIEKGLLVEVVTTEGVHLVDVTSGTIIRVSDPPSTLDRTGSD